MKIPTILSALVATALTFAVNAAPAPTSGPKNSTIVHDKTTFDDALFASIVKYDYKAAEALVDHYNKAVYGNNTIARTNGVVKAAAVSSDVLPFCVGYATNPVRIKIFKNKMTCDFKGWSTLFIYTAHTKKDKNHAPYPICSAVAGSAPDRSMFYSGKTNCDVSGWNHDFAFYESGSRNGDSAANPLNENTIMWQAWNPHRMMLYPYYNGADHGWEQAYNLQYRSRYRLASSNDMNWLKQTMHWHESAHKQISVTSTSDSKINRCALDLIQVWNNRVRFDGSGSTTIYPGNDSPGFVNDAKRDGCSDLVKSSQIRAGRFNIAQQVTVVEVMIDNKVYAAASIQTGGWMANGQSNIRMALQESLRTGAPVAVASDGVPSDSVTAFIQGTFVVIGGPQAYKAAI